MLLDRRALALCLSLALSGAALAQDAAPKSSETKPAENRTSVAVTKPTGVLALLPSDSSVERTVQIGGKPLTYQATAGTLTLYGQDGERAAAIFYTSYIARDRSPNRPITFAFNGGPGAASAFLHLGVVGPRILDFGPSERDGANAKLIDNPQAWLDFTDLVLIDPVGTGWSRAAKPDNAKDFYGVQQDAHALAKTIALYLAHNGRVTSPRFLLGESYGGFRAIKVAEALRDDQGIIASGVIMLSPLVEAGLQFGASRFALGAALQFPSLAAAELERKGAFSAPALRAAEQFALNEVLPTLAGPPPTGEAAQKFYGRVAEMTGLPVDVVTRTRGFVRDSFVKNLRENARDIVSSYDVNLAAPDPYPESATSRGNDPVLDGFVRAYGSAFASYARDELGFKTDMTYTLLASDINGKWDWGRGGRAQASVGDDMRELLSSSPSFRIMIAHGGSDLVTPYAVSKYVVDHLPDALRARASLRVYRGGHMFYTKPDSRIAFTADAKSFYEGTID